MDNAKTLSVPLDQYFKLSTVMSPTIDGDVVKILKKIYAQAIGYLMYSIVCTRPDIAYVVSIVSKYVTKSRKESIKYCSTEHLISMCISHDMRAELRQTNDANTKRSKHIPNPSVFLIKLTFVCILSSEDAHILKKLFLKIKPEG